MDYYTALGIEKTATGADIKKAYRKLASQHHPDKGGDKEKFQQIQEAYAVLSDENKRAQYDNPHPNGFNFDYNNDPRFTSDVNDLFAHFFGQGRSNPFNQQQQQHRQNPIYRTRVGVSLIEAYNGDEKMLQMQTPSGTKVIKIDVPKGVQSGDKIRYDNVIENGTLIIEFIVTPDLRFERKGWDLYSNLPVSVLDLIVGTKIKFTTISGKTLEINIKPETQPYMQLKMGSQGMPKPDGTFGDQILLIKPYIPANIDSEIIESITKHQDTK